MQRFVPIIICRKAEPRNARRAVLQLRDFFGQRHAADQIILRAPCNGCDGSRQIGGSLISGTRVAAAEKASASSEALNETTDAPEAFFTSNVLNFAAALARRK